MQRDPRLKRLSTGGEFRDSGIRGFRDSGIEEFRDSGIRGFMNLGFWVFRQLSIQFCAKSAKYFSVSL
ncbi:hypothetical protein D1AOALGA4SA_6219 [Olavius algarvensis Delta 1 endosymbiont]|nr:hypothetical protein D1AOALGA4SA_6219 [Olavius algarvensis Delta 1 endosymbiont]